MNASGIGSIKQTIRLYLKIRGVLISDSLLMNLFGRKSTVEIIFGNKGMIVHSN